MGGVNEHEAISLKFTCIPEGLRLCEQQTPDPNHRITEMNSVVAPAAGNNPEPAASFGTTEASAKTDVEASVRAASAVLVVVVAAAAAAAVASVVLAAVAAVAVEFVDFVTGNVAVLVEALEVVHQRLAPLVGSLLLLLLRSY